MAVSAASNFPRNCHSSRKIPRMSKRVMWNRATPQTRATARVAIAQRQRTIFCHMKRLYSMSCSIPDLLLFLVPSRIESMMTSFLSSRINLEAVYPVCTFSFFTCGCQNVISDIEALSSVCVLTLRVKRLFGLFCYSISLVPHRIKR